MKSETDQTLIIAKEWLQTGYGIGIWVDKPGQEWPDYTHEQDEVFTLVLGSVELIISEKTVSHQIGESILIPRNTKHTVINDGDSFNLWLYGYKGVCGVYPINEGDPIECTPEFKDKHVMPLMRSLEKLYQYVKSESPDIPKNSFFSKQNASKESDKIISDSQITSSASTHRPP